MVTRDLGSRAAYAAGLSGSLFIRLNNGLCTVKCKVSRSLLAAAPSKCHAAHTFETLNIGTA
jgi:hypothetical protein